MLSQVFIYLLDLWVPSPFALYVKQNFPQMVWKTLHETKRQTYGLIDYCMIKTGMKPLTLITDNVSYDTLHSDLLCFCLKCTPFSTNYTVQSILYFPDLAL